MRLLGWLGFGWETVSEKRQIVTRTRRFDNGKTADMGTQQVLVVLQKNKYTHKERGFFVDQHGESEDLAVWKVKEVLEP